MIRLRLAPNKRNISFISILWKLSDMLFKYISWCMLLGLIQYGYDKSKNWRLLTLSIIIFSFIYTRLVFDPYGRGWDTHCWGSSSTFSLSFSDTRDLLPKYLYSHVLRTRNY